ncbi:MAG: aminoacyl-tRNA hydrolase [Cyanobacteriota bacterium]
MYLVAGLGNPGAQYEGTRHNIGFRVVSKLAERHNIAGKISQDFKALCGKGSVCGVDTIVVEPLTFMNLSGYSILKILNWYKIESSNLIVIYDDIDLNLGRLRFRPAGSDGGHKGIRSIIEQLGNKTDFSRLRVGIGPGPSGPLRKNFVLQPFLPEQEKLLSDSISLAVDALEIFIKEGINSAMNKYNGVDLSAPPKKEKKRTTLFIDNSLSKLENEAIIINNYVIDKNDNQIFPVDLTYL